MNKNREIVLSTAGLQAGYIRGGKPMPVLSDINLHLHKGELICLLGPNGSGKSTLIRTLAGIIPPLNGTIKIDNVDIQKMDIAALAKKRSMVLTEHIKADNLSVAALLAMGRIPYTGWLGTLKEADHKIIENTLEVFGLSDFRNRDFNNLSDGEKQKVLIARAFAQQSPVIFLDEPTAFLDIPNKMEIMQLLKKLCMEENKSIFISTHDLDLATQTSDRLLLISRAGELYNGCAEDLMLAGVFEKVFGNNIIRFDVNSLRFIKPNEVCKRISLEGEPSVMLLTEKALNRIGFYIHDQETLKVMVVKEKEHYKWTLNEGEHLNEFNSIEGLLNYLSGNDET
jgi:iron complex transport system ATP-binding protein